MREYEKIEGGIKKGDIITLVNGRRIKLVSYISFTNVPKEYGYDAEYGIGYFRGTYTLDLECIVDPTATNHRTAPETTDYDVVKVERDGEIIYSRT